ncbi:glycosyltransferase family 4 protein [bacterium]|nr:glycosyltransferase family 4 protein [bacterium]
MSASPGKKKVLIIVENLPVPFDRRVWMEATTLHADGWQVSVICPTGKGYTKEYEEIDGIHIYRHPLPEEVSSAFGYLREYSAALYWQFRLSMRVARERGFRIIQACNPPDLMFLVALPYKYLRGVKFIFDHHDLSLELYESKFNKRGFFHTALAVMEKLTFWTADRVMSTNESYKEVAIKRGGKNPDHVQVVRSGPDLNFFNPVPVNKSLKQGRKFLVGYLGVMGEFDGVDHLVRAAHHLISEDKRDDIHFVFVGDGPMRSSLIDLAEEFGISEQLEFTGRIPDKEMIETLSSCDVCVNADPLNPLNDKSTMNKILEYMALSKPIVQYELKEGRYSAGEASLYAEPNNTRDMADKIAELLADEPKRAEMGRIGRARMEEQFEWKHQRMHLLDVYNRLIEE